MKKMNEVAVDVVDGEIFIFQKNYSDEDSIVALQPEQVELVGKWLADAREQIDSEASSIVVSPDLIRLIIQFVDRFELVFGHDWEFTKLNLADDSQTMYIQNTATFLLPGIADESNNWANRGALLGAYRAIKKELDRQGIA